MLDDLDYEAFGALLDRAGDWTAEERRLVEAMLPQQRTLLDSAHPKDRKAQTRLRVVVDEIEAAIARHDSR